MGLSANTEISLEAQIVALLAKQNVNISWELYLEACSQAKGPEGLFKAAYGASKLLDSLPNLKEALQQPSQVRCAKDQICTWNEQGIWIIPLGDPNYPELLARIYKPPFLLFARGEKSGLKALHRACLSIVGSRKADQFGCGIARELASDLARRGTTIVSGLAYGIDASAHRGALLSGIKSATVAILGNGLSRVYPAQHEALADEILQEGGLLISQFEPDEKPLPHNFLNRNRVIAGLSLGTLVVQATERSGSLVTARYALEEGREVFAVPGKLNDPRHAGTHRIIREGAHLCASVEHILDVIPTLGATPPSTRNPQPEFHSVLPPQQQRILKVLDEADTLTYEELDNQIGAEMDLGTELLELELAALIVRLPGNQIARRTTL